MPKADDPRMELKTEISEALESFIQLYLKLAKEMGGLFEPNPEAIAKKLSGMTNQLYQKGQKIITELRSLDKMNGDAQKASKKIMAFINSTDEVVGKYLAWIDECDGIIHQFQRRRKPVTVGS